MTAEEAFAVIKWLPPEHSTGSHFGSTVKEAPTLPVRHQTPLWPPEQVRWEWEGKRMGRRKALRGV